MMHIHISYYSRGNSNFYVPILREKRLIADLHENETNVYKKF